MKRKPSLDFCGYWQRHSRQDACSTFHMEEQVSASNMVMMIDLAAPALQRVVR
jgi:hypothetical protein